jgi:hypothetical protein
VCRISAAYLQMNMYLMRLVCCMDLDAWCNREAPRGAVLGDLEDLGDIEADCEPGEGTGSSAAVEGEDLAAGDAVDVRC